MPAAIQLPAKGLSNAPGSGVVGYSGFAGPFQVAVRKFGSTSGSTGIAAGFANTWFTAGYGLRPYSVARGSLDDATDIADANKISIIPCEGQGGVVTAIFEMYKDNATLPTISSQPPKGIMYGWHPYAQDIKRLSSDLTVATGFAEPTRSGATQYVNNGLWVPLELADGSGLSEATFDTTTNVFKHDSAGGGTNKVAVQSAPLKWLLRGAKAVMFLPTGSTSGPVFSASGTGVLDAQVLVNFGS